MHTCVCICMCVCVCVFQGVFLVCISVCTMFVYVCHVYIYICTVICLWVSVFLSTTITFRQHLDLFQASVVWGVELGFLRFLKQPCTRWNYRATGNQTGSGHSVYISPTETQFIIYFIDVRPWSVQWLLHLFRAQYNNKSNNNNMQNWYITQNNL